MPETPITLRLLLTAEMRKTEETGNSEATYHTPRRPDYEHDSVTEKGKREVELLGQRLAKENITKIYCSPLGRARATAAPTCRLTRDGA